MTIWDNYLSDVFEFAVSVVIRNRYVDMFMVKKERLLLGLFVEPFYMEVFCLFWQCIYFVRPAQEIWKYGYSSILRWLPGISQAQITMKRRGLPLVLDAASLASLKYWIPLLCLSQWQFDSSPTCPRTPVAQFSHKVREYFFLAVDLYEDNLHAKVFVLRNTSSTIHFVFAVLHIMLN